MASLPVSTNNRKMRRNVIRKWTKRKSHKRLDRRCKKKERRQKQRIKTINNDIAPTTQWNELKKFFFRYVRTLRLRKLKSEKWKFGKENARKCRKTIEGDAILSLFTCLVETWACVNKIHLKKRSKNKNETFLPLISFMNSAVWRQNEKKQNKKGSRAVRHCCSIQLHFTMTWNKLCVSFFILFIRQTRQWTQKKEENKINSAPMTKMMSKSGKWKSQIDAMRLTSSVLFLLQLRWH